eukprot:6173439-Pleurochrysis_carterae.AAC.1
MLSKGARFTNRTSLSFCRLFDSCFLDAERATGIPLGSRTKNTAKKYLCAVTKGRFGIAAHASIAAECDSIAIGPRMSVAPAQPLVSPAQRRHDTLRHAAASPRQLRLSGTADFIGPPRRASRYGAESRGRRGKVRGKGRCRVGKQCAATGCAMRRRMAALTFKTRATKRGAATRNKSWPRGMWWEWCHLAKRRRSARRRHHGYVAARRTQVLRQDIQGGFSKGTSAALSHLVPGRCSQEPLCIPMTNTPVETSLPADPSRIGRRPRRVRRIGREPRLKSDHLCKAGMSIGNTWVPVKANCPLPPACTLGLKSHAKPMVGFAYGPRNTCPVDTLLTVLQFVLRKEERSILKQGSVGRSDVTGGSKSSGARNHSQPAGQAVQAHAQLGHHNCAAERDAAQASADMDKSTKAWKAVFRAHRLHRANDARAKEAWYRRMHKQKTLTPGSPFKCECTCRCVLCRAGLCPSCQLCNCNEARLMGHVFGIAEQFFDHLIPSTLPSSPFHFTTWSAWHCDACTYSYAASMPAVQLPLLLTAEDVADLLAGGAQPEIGALCEAHLSANAYDYGGCPMCGKGRLVQRAQRAQWSDLLLVELGRQAATGTLAGAAHTLPWRLSVAPSVALAAGGTSAQYHAQAVIYNGGNHWWADLVSSRHFVKRQSSASYRYDGLEANGLLRYTGPSLTLSSDPRQISMVLYRRAADAE